MNKILKPHQYLLLVLGVFLLLQVILYLFLFRPQRQAQKEIALKIRDIRSSLAGGHWPMDRKLLEQHLSELTQEENLEKSSGKGNARLHRARAILSRSFMGNIESRYGNVTSFMGNAAFLEYQAEFERVSRDMKSRNVFFSENVLGLGSDTMRGSVYQMLMRLWTAEKICQLALKNELAIALYKEKGSSSARRAAPIAHVISYPARGYFEDSKAEKPYLLDFPVEVEVEGTLEACKDFLHDLDSGGVCIPPLHYEFVTLPPKKRVSGDEVWMGVVRMRLICASFLAPEYKFEK